MILAIINFVVFGFLMVFIIVLVKLQVDLQALTIITYHFKVKSKYFVLELDYLHIVETKGQ